MKCIHCQNEIHDDSAFCPNCGKPQNETAKKTFPITERAFCRIFKPSFFGGLGLDFTEFYQGLMLDFLSLSKPLSEDEIASINHGFDSLLNNANKEYLLKKKHFNFILDKDKMPQIENEKFRYNFLSDSIFHEMDIFYESKNREHFGNIWLFSLLSALDGDYNDEKEMFFSRMKNIFPISRENFIKFYYGDSEELRSSSYKKYEAISSNLFSRVADKLVEHNLLNKTKEINLDENKLAEKIPEDFDFYNIVEEKTKSLCELEYQIQELENSEGKYFEIADKIAELSRKELELLEDLPGFDYQKF